MEFVCPFVEDVADEIVLTLSAIFSNAFSLDDLEDALDDPSIRRIFRVACGTGVFNHFGDYAIQVAYVRDSGKVAELAEDSRYTDLYVEREVAPGRTYIERWRAA